MIRPSPSETDCPRLVVLGCRRRLAGGPAQGQALRTLGLLAQSALLALNQVPQRYLSSIHQDGVSIALGAVAALGAMAFMRPRATSPLRSLSLLVLPAFVLVIAQLGRGPLSDTATEIGLAWLLTGCLGFAVVAWWRLGSPAAQWGLGCLLVTLWWFLSTPPQRLVVGLALLGLVAFVRSAGQMTRPAVASALVGLALVLALGIDRAFRRGIRLWLAGDFSGLRRQSGRHVPQGALTLMLKAWMPLAVAAAVFTNEDHPAWGAPPCKPRHLFWAPVSFTTSFGHGLQSRFLLYDSSHPGSDPRDRLAARNRAVFLGEDARSFGAIDGAAVSAAPPRTAPVAVVIGLVGPSRECRGSSPAGR